MNTWDSKSEGLSSWFNGIVVATVFLLTVDNVRSQSGSITAGATAISGGQHSHALLIRTDGTVWTWGANDSGQLGDGTTADSAVPIPVAANGLSNAVAVAGGYSHSLSLAADKRVWAWGEGDLAQLGNGQWTNSSQPLLVTGLTNVTAVSAGGWHSLVISNGFVWTWGSNPDGELGNGTRNDSSIPVRANLLAGVTAIAAGMCHSLALSNGTVWGFGENRNGQLGIGSSFVNASNAAMVSGLLNISKIAAGGFHSLAVSNGWVWAWGENGNGQLGDGTTNRRYTPVLVLGLSNVTDVAGGNLHSLALKSDGTVWAWGGNFACQLGDATTVDRWRPVPVQGLRQITAIGGGEDYSIAIRSSQTVWTWGQNDFGQLGDDTGITRRRPFAVEALTIFPPGNPNPLARNTRFERGRGWDQTFYSFVIPLNGQKGVKLAATGGNSDILFRTNMWTNALSHLNGSISIGAPLPFKNPIAAFGSRVGGSSLYYDQGYDFGVYAGSTNNSTNAISIEVYNKSDFSFVTNYYLSIPNVTQTNVWANFLTNGFTVGTNAYGLNTSLYFPAPFNEWGPYTNAPYRLTHTATPTNYFYAVQLRGQVGTNLMVTQNNTNWWSRLYTLEFDSRPPWRAVFIDQPQFEGQPMPSLYQGKTVDELLNASMLVTNAVSLAPSACTNIDQSPELRRHPILDQFVSDMGKDPLALVNFVVNEIALTDAIAYNDNGSVTDTSINLGGVNRSALGTYLEGQGSPTEQCALLVYLLRQSGIPACYIYPPHDGMLMTDTRMSHLLRMQLRGAVNDQGEAVVPQLIPVNYPWVAAYVSTNNGLSTNWIHIYPWLKDTSITEGLSLYSYMPSNYNNGYKWLKQYCLGDTNIMSLATDSDTPLALLPKFLGKNLLANYPGVSVDDIGVRIFDRRHNYSRWGDLPGPTWVTNTSIAVESLSSSSITNVSPMMTNIFDTVSVEVYSVANSNSIRIATGDMQMVDLHNRKFLLRHEYAGNSQFRMILSLSSYRPDTTNPVAFASVHFLDKTDTNVLKNVITTNILNSGDDSLNLVITRKRHRAISSLNGYGNWDLFPGLSEYQSTVFEGGIKKGDLAAICLNAGRVSKKMLDVYGKEFWEMERQVAANPSLANSVSAEIYQGTTAYLMGMGFYERVSRFDEIGESLHKIHTITRIDCGLSKIAAKRVSGSIPNAAITLIQPGVDMLENYIVFAGNGTLRPDEGADAATANYDYSRLAAVEGSAEEHQIINTYFKESAAISTVKLLQIAQRGTNSGGPGILFLDKNNYLNYGTNKYNGVALKDSDTSMWKTVTNTFVTSQWSNYVQALITPGVQTNSSGSYKGMGVMVLEGNGFAALISPNNANGAFGSYVPDPSFTTVNIPNLSLNLDWSGNYSLTITQPTPTQAEIAPDVWNLFDSVQQQNNAPNVVIPDSQNQANQQILSNLGIGLGTDADNRSAAVGQQVATGSEGSPSWLRSVFEAVKDPVSVVSGEFYIDATDLALPGPMPLQVRRNYSSQNLANNQFGYGWKLNYMPFLSVSADTNVIYAAEPDGAVIAYLRTGTNTVWLPTNTVNPRVSNRTTAGIGSTANVLNGRVQSETSGSTNFYKLFSPDGSLRIFQVMAFTITNAYTNNRPFLIKWQDASSNFWTIEYGTNSDKPDFGQARRIKCSNGSFLGFYFDYYGHVTEAYTGDGRRLVYEYDNYGDLTTVTRPDQSQIDYEYEHKTVPVSGTNQTYSTHLILKEWKPDGRQLVNVYDDQRRVTNQLSTAGQDLNPVLTATFIYSNNFKLTNSFTNNNISGYTVIKDAFNNATRYDYTNALITSITNPLGQATLQSWYMPADTNVLGYYPRSLKQLVDLRGLTNQFQYDQNGNATNITLIGDLTGTGNSNEQAVIVRAFDTNNLITQEIDMAGNTNLFFYTNSWLMNQTVFCPSNSSPKAWVTNVVIFYNVTNVVNNGGSTVTNVAFGLPQKTIRAFNSPDTATDENVFDGRGFKTADVHYTGTTDPDVTHQYFYNSRDELVEQDDGAGRATIFDHDPLGRLTATEVFEAGESIPISWNYLYYNGNGEAIWSDGPRYDPEDYVFFDYDGAGRKTVEMHWRSEARADGTGVGVPTGDDLYATTFSQWDAFGNLVKVTDPRGVMVTNTFDSIGQMLTRAVIDTNGTVLSTGGFAYEPGGQVSFATNALEGVTQMRYTSTGKLKYQKNPDGSTNAWTFYIDGRPRRETQRNGAYWETTYNDTNRWTVRSFYSPGGTLLATNRTERDRRGNVTRTVDEGGFPRTNIWDGLDRLVATVGPVLKNPVNMLLPDGSPQATYQQAVTNYFDAAGVVTTNVNGNLEQAITYFDALKRPTRQEIRDANNNLVHEKSWAYSPDHHSVTVTAGSEAGAISTTTYTDTDGREVLTVGYPVSGVLSFSLQKFDVGGNRVQSRQYSSTNGDVVLWATNSATFDGLNRVLTQTVRDGATTTFTYDAANNRTSRTMPGSLSWYASYNSAGQPLQDYDLGAGAVGTRTNANTYYAAGSPFAGLLQTHIDGRGVTNTVSYDDWLRPVTNTFTGPLTEHNLTVSRGFDNRSLATNITETFATNTAGPATSLIRTYDAYGQLTGDTITIDGQIQSSESQCFDSAGRRLGFRFGAGYAENQLWQADGLLAALQGATGNAGYTYTTAGLLTTRSLTTPAGNPVRTTTITSRDGMGLPLTITNKVAALGVMGETLTWRGDQLLATHTLARADFTDNRVYFYAIMSRKLTEERLNLDATQRWTNLFTLDNGQTGRAGVITKVANSSGAGVSPVWSGNTDGLSRIATETNTTVHRPAWGTNNGIATVSIFVDNKPMPVSITDTQQLQWRTTLELTPGSHQLRAEALHPSGLFTAYATNTITASPTNYDTLTTQHDGSGNVSNRLWISAGQTNSQVLFYDGHGRLVKVIERDSSQNGRNWSAVYDALNRLLRTTDIPVVNNVTNSGEQVIVDHYYDPQFEFLEIGVNENGHTTWKVMGPDFDGRYGSKNGTGGFEAIVPGPELYCPIVSDIHGNLLAVNDPKHGGLIWYPSRVSAFGTVPGTRPVPVGQAGPDLGAKYVYRNRAMTSIGMTWMGMNWYRPESANFLTFDALGHAGNREEGYGPCAISPLVDWDSDGRFGKAVARDIYAGVAGTANTAISIGISPLVFLEGTVSGLLIPERGPTFGLWAASSTIAAGFSSFGRTYDVAQHADTFAQIGALLGYQIPVLGNFIPGPEGQQNANILATITSRGVGGVSDAAVVQNDNQAGNALGLRDQMSAPYVGGTGTEVISAMLLGNTSRGLEYFEQAISDLGGATGTIDQVDHSGGVIRGLEGSKYLGYFGIGVDRNFSAQGPAFGYFNNVQNLSFNLSPSRYAFGEITSTFAYPWSLGVFSQNTTVNSAWGNGPHVQPGLGSVWDNAARQFLHH